MHRFGNIYIDDDDDEDEIKSKNALSSPLIEKMLKTRKEENS